jgi:hypothetical protein
MVEVSTVCDYRYGYGYLPKLANGILDSGGVLSYRESYPIVSTRVLFTDKARQSFLIPLRLEGRHTPCLSKFSQSFILSL